MTHVSIIGTGTMAQAISGVVTKGGHTVDLIAHADAGAQVSGDIVVLAVPYPALADVVATRGEQLAGRIVVDISNPVNFQTFDSLTVAADGSATAELAAALPDSKVLKAFNANFAGTLSSGTAGPVPTTVLIAGDDGDAKALLTDVVAAAGLRAVDAGALGRARELEALGFLQISLAVQGKTPWTGGFAVTA